MDLNKDIFSKNRNTSIAALLEDLNEMHSGKAITSDNLNSNLVDVKFLAQLKSFDNKPGIQVYLGRHLKEIKIVITDTSTREHFIIIEYRKIKNFVITQTSLPYDRFQSIEYNSLDALCEVYREYIEKLQNYLNELDMIAEFCSVVDPVKPSYKDEYRKIVISDGVWLHVEVTSDGGVTNVHLVGGDNGWRERLHKGLASWNHDVMIYKNIMDIFDLESFPDTQRVVPKTIEKHEHKGCSICLCFDLEGSAPPRPLCPNLKCGVYFHRSCLYQWLSACGGAERRNFAARGSCPSCFNPISCEDHD